jgi:hypothetical protein
MNTLEKIKNEAAESVAKLNRGESLTKSELRVLQIHNSMTGANSFRAGKRKQIKTGK